MYTQMHINDHLLVEIAKHSREVWRLFSVICKRWSTVFNRQSYELQFWEIITYDKPVYSGKFNVFIPAGSKAYKLDEMYHRIGGPAIISPDGKMQVWIQYDKKHRDVDPETGIHEPAVMDEIHREWRVNGYFHRYPDPVTGKTGPTHIDSTGSQYWLNRKGYIHNLEGPALITDPLGRCVKLYYINGWCLSKCEFRVTRDKILANQARKARKRKLRKLMK